MFRRYRRAGQVIGPAIATLLMVLCLGCQILQPPTCSNCGSGIGTGPQAVSDDRFPLFEFGVPAGTFLSPSFPRLGPNLVVEAFMIVPGQATITMLEAPRGGQMMPATDANSSRTVSATGRWMVKGVLAEVSVQVVVSSGVWAIWGAWNQQPSDRGQYYDRNGVSKTNYFAVTDTYHVVTTRWSYTVPTGKKAYVDTVLAVIQQVTAPSIAARAAAQIILTPSGGSTAVVADAEMLASTTGVGQQDKDSKSALGFLAAGDALLAQTFDGSNGGGGYHLFLVSAKYVEFDF